DVGEHLQAGGPASDFAAPHRRGDLVSAHASQASISASRAQSSRRSRTTARSTGRLTAGKPAGRSSPSPARPHEEGAGALTALAPSRSRPGSAPLGAQGAPTVKDWQPTHWLRG